MSYKTEPSATANTIYIHDTLQQPMWTIIGGELSLCVHMMLTGLDVGP